MNQEVRKDHRLPGLELDRDRFSILVFILDVVVLQAFYNAQLMRSRKEPHAAVFDEGPVDCEPNDRAAGVHRIESGILVSDRPVPWRWTEGRKYLIAIHIKFETALSRPRRGRHCRFVPSVSSDFAWPVTPPLIR